MSGQGVGAVELIVGMGILTAAAVALFRRPPVAGVVAFMVFGVLVSILWGLAGAPDVALAEAAIGTGVTGALLIEAATTSRRVTRPGTRARAAGAGTAGRGAPSYPLLVWALGVAVAVGVTFAAVTAAARTASDPPGLGEPVRANLWASGVSNPVTGVLLNYRSYDTLLEIAVLLVAVVVLASLRAPGGVHREPPKGTALGPVVGTIVRAVGPVLLLIAAWLLFAGSSRPGGAFQAGAVVAAVLILFDLAGVRPLRGGMPARLAEVFGLTAFLALAALGLTLTGGWLQLEPGWAGAAIVALESILAAAIGANLAAMFDAIRAVRPMPADPEAHDDVRAAP